MSARDLVRRLDDLDIDLALTEGRVRYRGRTDRLTPELLGEMKRYQAELAAILSRRERLCWPPTRDEVAGHDRRGPLTTTQRTLWATSYFSDDGTYNLCGALRLCGRLDADVLLAAVADVHHRNPSLRTVFPVDRGAPRQRILPRVTPPVSVLDLSHRPPAAALEECLRECARHADRKLPLEDAPPVRMWLYRLAEDDHVFFVVLHHVIADGASVGILVDDLARCYNARLDGGHVAPAATGLDMIDYARWEADTLEYADLGPARRYWRDLLSGATPGSLPLPPPLDEPPAGRGSAVTTVVDATTTAAVRRLASESRSSTFTIVSAALSIMLSRFTGREDMVVGMPVSRRDRDGLARLVGLLLDMVPVRLEVGGGPSFRELVRRTRTAVLGAWRNALVPTELVVGDSTRSDAAGRTLFNVLFTDAGADLPAPDFHGLRVRPLDVEQVGAKFDLNFLVRDDGDTLRIEAEFDRRAVTARDVTAMTSMVRGILALGTANPHSRAADLDTAPFGVVGAGAVGAPADRTPGAAESLAGRLASVARDRGDAVAVSHDGATISYRALASRVDQVARGLRELGVGAGDIVAVAVPRSMDLVVAVAGIMGSGAACVVLDDAWPPARVDQVLTDSGACRTIATEPDATGARVTVAQLAELGSTAPPAAPVPAHATAYVIYTSGSTGRPKGVHVTHHNLLSLLDATGNRYGFGADDTWSLFHSCSFDVSMYEMFGCLLHGGRLAIVPKWTTREPEAFARLLRRERVTVLSQTPSALSVMLPAIASTPGSAEHVRYVIFAGEALDRRLVDQWYRTVGDRAQLVNMYGTTETTVHASWRFLRPDDRGTAESDIGDPLPGTSLHLLHDNGTAVRDRCVGEIYVGGPQVSAGYVGRPRETALRFVPDPCGPVPGGRLYRSGDLARRTGTGLAYLGRRDAQVQVNGFRIELSEIEQALAAQPGVAAAGAATHAGPTGALAIVGAVVADDHATPSTADLFRRVRAVLPGYMVPNKITIVPRLPLTSNGKLDRAAVAAAAMAPVARPGAAGATPPRGASEAVLLDLFREVLEDSSITTAADFFDLGGDSMRAIRLVSLARDRGVRLTVNDVYAAPALVDLAARAGVEDPDRVEPPGPRAPFSLLPAQARASLPAGVTDAYPMTAMQSGMIYHQELAPEARTYHIVLSYRVRGPMDPAAFRAAVLAVMTAHPVLRTSFDTANEWRPVQRVHTGVEPPVRFADIRHLGEADQESAIRDVVRTETASDFDLTRPPLFRLIVLTTSNDDYQLVFSHHHAILDGWSVNIFFADLHAQYRGRLDGKPVPPLPPPRTTFADYLALEQSALDGATHQEFWRERTATAAPLIAPDRQGPPRMRQHRVELPGTIGQLRAVASRLGVPLKALLCAAHVRVVSWLTGHDDVSTSLVFACRPEAPDSDRTLGLFLNQLPLRVLLGDQTWTELAGQVHREEIDMMPHRWYPNAAIQRPHGSRPLFDSSFNFTDFHTTRRLVLDRDIEVLDAYELESTHYAFGSNYTVDVRTHELRLILEYDESVLAGSTLALAAQAHRRILTALIADPDTACRSTPLPGAAEATVTAPAHLVRSVRDVWVDVLGPGDYDLDTSFFEAGGSSLTAMHAVSRLRARHGTLSLGAFVATPTIAGIARALGPADPVPPAPLPSPTDGPRRYPLTAAQRQLFDIASRLPEVALFGMHGALEADGWLDLDVLRRTFAVLVRRHEALRTRVESTGTGPEQVVEPHAEIDVEVVDLSGEPTPVSRCEERMAAVVREPVALDRAPLMRVVVYRIHDRRHVVYLNIHHLVCDGWSLGLLLRDAARTYRTIAAGGDPAEGPPRGGELARARTEWAGSPEAERQRTYWVDRLAPPWSSLTGDPSSRFVSQQRVPLVQRLRSASCQRRLTASAVGALRAGARRHGLTEFMVLLTAYASTLRSWTGQDDIRIGTMTANRAHPGMADVVGLLANTVVLRMRVGADADPVELARHARHVCVEAYDSQDLPFEDVLAALAARYPREERASQVFDVMLIMQDETGDVAASEDLSFARYRPAGSGDVLGSPVAATTCDFVLAVTPADGELVLTLLYKPATTRRELAVELLDDIAAAVTATAGALAERRP